jgi:apolipoprotein N-acyltransferase
MYRKTRPFPFTEHVPAWLDGPRLRAALPWLGSWKPGNGARVFPLRLADGREVPVLPLICLDDTDTALALQGARQGAQALLTMSNDAWFTQYPIGAQLHQTVAAFRSIETGLPQFRVTTNGFSAVIDARGGVLVGSRMGERTLVVGALPVPLPAPTLLVRWGDWVGPVAWLFLGGLALVALAGALPSRWRRALGAPGGEIDDAPNDPLPVALLPPLARWLAAGLRAAARLGLLWMGYAVLTDEAMRVNTLAQIRSFVAVFVVPELLAWLLVRAFSARAIHEGEALVFRQGARRLAVPLGDVAGVEPWRWPLPTRGALLRLRSGAVWPFALALHRPELLAQRLGVPLAPAGRELPARLAAYAQARQGVWRTRLAHPAVKFVLLPLLLALPAFHLHQHIAYGSAVGEYLSFGLRAYLTTLALWWAAWTIGVTLWAAALRALIEAGSLLGALLQPSLAWGARRWLEGLSLAAMYLGLPLWLASRVWGG